MPLTLAKVTGMSVIQAGDYKLNGPETIETPAMLVYSEMVRHNIREIVEICGSPKRLIPHIKTHKSPAILRMQMEAGINAFKCATLSEAEMIAASGAQELVIAFPILHPKKIARLMALKASHPLVHVSVIAGDLKHVELLSAGALSHGQQLSVYLDLEIGSEHGTGVQPGDAAEELYVAICNAPGLSVAGIHAYDGRVGETVEPESRRLAVEKNLEYIHALRDRVNTRGLDVPDIIAGGSWSFRFYLQDPRIRVSPGNWIYFDLVNSVMTDLNFKKACAILGQVVDAQPLKDTVTIDIGQKGIAHDPRLSERLRIIGKENSELVGQSEEHGIVRLNGEQLEIGDFFLASPGHACMTTVKYPEALVINENGDIIDQFEHTARDRA
jgi:D-serine deaminase-like pyridoxal phosphate-dependent protein